MTPGGAARPPSSCARRSPGSGIASFRRRASLDIFEAKAWILREPAETLARYVDIPWCRADEYQVRKIALVLDAAVGERWEEIED